MKKILITGGAGFIGSHVAERYIKNGEFVIIVDNLSSGKMENIASIITHPNCRFCKCDITNLSELDKVFKEFSPDIINHHAAQKSVAESVTNPLANLVTNEIGLLNLITMCKRYKIEKFIYVSSGGALAKDIAITERSSETDTPQLQSPYAITKYAGEQYLAIYSKLYSFTYVSLRYANVYGPRQIPDGECGVIPIFVNNILKGVPSKLMAYEDMPRGCIRDYINVSDVVNFNELVTYSDEGMNDVYNVGTGIGLSVLDIYEQLVKTFESDIAIETVGPRIGDLKVSILSIKKASGKFGWYPRVNLEEGLLQLKKSH